MKFKLLRLLNPEKAETAQAYLGFGAEFVEPMVIRVMEEHAHWMSQRLWSGNIGNEPAGDVESDPGAPWVLVKRHANGRQAEIWGNDARTYWFRKDAIEGRDRFRIEHADAIARYSLTIEIASRNAPMVDELDLDVPA